MRRNTLLLRIVWGLFALTTGTILHSCSDYLDVVPDNIPTIDHAFADRHACEGYLFTCYSYLPRYGNVYETPDFMGSDELFTYDTPLNRMDRRMISLSLGFQNANDPFSNPWDGTQNAQPLYKAIRDCNIFLENVDKPYDLEEYERIRWEAEVKFLKAFYHFYLMQYYGPIIIVDENMPVSASIDEMCQYRVPFDECVSYVSNLLDTAASYLPLKITDRTNELGRATKPIALAVKAKLLTMAASPLFNGNNDYAEIIDNREVKLFNTEYDQQKWVKAAEACREAIASAEEAGFGLLYAGDIPQTYTLNDTLQQQYNLRMILFNKWNKEMLWGSVKGNYKSGDSGLQDVTGCKISSKEVSQTNVRQQMVPSFETVEAYYTKNGVPINEDKEFDYSGRFNLRKATEAYKWYIKTGEETVNLHFDREPRFYASIGFDRAIWWGNGSYEFDESKYNDDGIVRYIHGRGGETAGKTATDYYSVTGYWAKKLNNPLDETGDNAPDDWGGENSMPYPIIRMADLYLLYAEALNEASDAPPAEAYHFIDLVRERAGLEGVKESWQNYSTAPDKPLTKEGFRSIIHQERQIELSMEGPRFWDVRRWKEAEKLWNINVRTWNIYGETAEDFYKPIIVDKRVFTRKDYLWPIKEYNLSVNHNLVQNFGW
jgi:hypothetical protein